MREKSSQSISPSVNDLLINVIIEIPEIVYKAPALQIRVFKNQVPFSKRSMALWHLDNIFKIRCLMVSTVYQGPDFQSCWLSHKSHLCLLFAVPLAIPGNGTAYLYTSPLNVCLWPKARESEGFFPHDFIPEKSKDGKQVYFSPPWVCLFPVMES